MKAQVRPRKAPTRPPDGFQMANMRPQDAPRNPASDIREACAFLAPRGGLTEHVQNQDLCVFHWFYNVFELWAKPRSSYLDTQTFKLLSLHWFNIDIMVPMLPREAPTRPPDGSQMAHMRPQDAPRSPPSDMWVACAFLGHGGG